MLSALHLLLGAGLAVAHRRYTALALFFGAIGDFLIGASHDGIVYGAIAFGIGHLFYLVPSPTNCSNSFFQATFARHLKRLYWPLVMLCLAWGGFVHRICLLPMVYVQPISTAILFAYSLTLTAVFLISGSLYFNGSAVDKPRSKVLPFPLLEVRLLQNNLLRFLGFSCFYCSDSLLIFNHTGFAVPSAELLILLSYFTAQYLIVWGNWISVPEETKSTKKRVH
jgi:uncharacterized membrane protein YhhN